MRIDQFISGGAVDLIADVLLLAGSDGSILDANPAALDCYGYTYAEMLALTVYDIRAPQDPAAVSRDIREAAEHGLQYEAEHRRSDGTLFPVEVKVAKISVNGETALVASVRDITERKQAETALRESQSLLQAVVDGTSDAVFVKDLEGRYLLFNRAAARASGKSPEEVIGHDDTFVFPAEEAAVVMEKDRAVIEGGVTTTYEERITGPNHELVVYSTTKGPARDSSGRIYGLFGIARDVTQQATAEDALTESERWLSESQRIASLGHYIYDIEKDRWEGSPALYDVLGVDEDYARDFAGWLAVVHPAEREGMAQYFVEDVLGKRAPFDIEYRIVGPRDGVERWVHGLGKVEFHEDGHPIAMFGIIQDITERKRLETVLLDTVNAVIDVVGNVSEMRDPYTAGHQRRVAELAAEIAREMGMSDAAIADIRVAGLMHDIGKMSVPAEILSKPTALSPIEFNLIKGHSEAGYNVIASAHMQDPIAELVYQHHERCDGSGYPRGLSADELLMGSRVLMVADVVEAMMSHRPYRASLGQDAALAEIAQSTGRLYDPEVVAACIRIFREHEFAFSEV